MGPLADTFAEQGESMPKTILIVEDHDQVRALLRDWLKAVFPDWTVLEAKTGEDAIVLARSQLPELILMDIELEQMNGIEATRTIKAIAPQSRVVMLTIHEEADYQVAAAAAGAHAYVTKRKMHTELVPVIKALLSQASNAAVKASPAAAA
jgi:DNA-binding NarL/FixJ family response regulator